MDNVGEGSPISQIRGMGSPPLSLLLYYSPQTRRETYPSVQITGFCIISSVVSPAKMLDNGHDSPSLRIANLLPPGNADMMTSANTYVYTHKMAT